MAVNPIPEGYHSVTPSVIVDGAEKFIQFVSATFGANERMRMPAPDGKIAHAEVNIGDSVVMVADVMPEWPAQPAFLHVYVEDCDSVFQKALAAGATVLNPLQDQFYGDRSGNVTDPFGNRWTISTHKEDVTEEDMMKRMESMAPA